MSPRERIEALERAQGWIVVPDDNVRANLTWAIAVARAAVDWRSNMLPAHVPKYSLGKELEALVGAIDGERAKP